jgi:putative membrane protein
MKLSSEDKFRIHAAIAAAESRVPVHVAVSVVPASDRYPLFPLAWGAILALLAGAALALAWPHMRLREAFGIEVVVFVLFSLVFDWWPLRLMLVPKHIRRRYAQALARREFAARILASNERRGGVLFFVSLGERYAEILADRDTHARVGQAVWDNMLGDFIAAAKSDRMAEGILTAIDACASAITPTARS